MKSVLTELPVLMFCLRGGLISGGVCALLRMPRALVLRRLRGRRLSPALGLLFGLLDVLAAASVVLALSVTLLQANGGELRLYALAGFAAGVAVVMHAAGSCC